jgi:hypothetical protein
MPPVVDQPSTITSVRIFAELAGVGAPIVISYDLNGGHGSTWRIPPELSPRVFGGADVIDVDVQCALYVGPGGTAHLFEVEIEGSLLLHPNVDQFETIATALSAAEPSIDWTQQASVLLGGYKRDEGKALDGPGAGGLVDTLLALRESAEEKEAEDRASKPAAKAAPVAKPVARQRTDAEIAEDEQFDAIWQLLSEHRDD